MAQLRCCTILLFCQCVTPILDATGPSTLTLSHAQIQAVPWETDAFPVVGTTLLFGIGIWKKYKSSNSNNRDLK